MGTHLTLPEDEWIEDPSAIEDVTDIVMGEENVSANWYTTHHHARSLNLINIYGILFDFAVMGNQFTERI